MAGTADLPAAPTAATAAAAVVAFADAATALTPALAVGGTEGTIWLDRPPTTPKTAKRETARKVEAFVNCISVESLTVL